MSSVRKVLSVGFIFFLSGRAYGWGDIGHAAVGEIAERNLSEKGQALVCEVLGVEPLAVSATFPDHVRSDPRFKAMAPYHFVEIPPGQSVTESLAKQVGKKNAHAMIMGAPDFIGRQVVPMAQRQTFLRYLVHMVGDVHQPLHVGNGWDMGANLCDVDWVDPETGEKVRTNLHSVIDDKIFEWEKKDFDTANRGRPGKYYGYSSLVDNISADASPEMKTVKEGMSESLKAQPHNWYEEAQALHPKLYKDKKPVSDPKERPYCKLHDPVTGKYSDGVYDKSEIPTLDEAYARGALSLAKQQILKGGRRLAAAINEIAENFPPKKTKAECVAALDAVSQIEKHTTRLPNAVPRGAKKVKDPGAAPEAPTKEVPAHEM